jgi:hypothetical protein
MSLLHPILMKTGQIGPPQITGINIFEIISRIDRGFILNIIIPLVAFLILAFYLKYRYDSKIKRDKALV